MLPHRVVSVTAHILFVVFSVFALDTPLRAADFNSALNAGKSMGQSSVGAYNPLNLNQTLQNKGLGTADTITPRSEAAAQDRGQYEGYYTSPGSLSTASSTPTPVGDFVKDSYQTRDVFNLQQDPTFGNKCIQTDTDGQCLMWSASKDVISQSYPDCEKVIVAQRDNPPTFEICSGTKGNQTFDCDVTTPVRIETEVVTTPCDASNIGYKPGQVYAVCRDYYQYYKSHVSTSWITNDCNCSNMEGYWCSSYPTEYIIGAPPPDATYLAPSAEIHDCDAKSGWDNGLTTIYHWYMKYKNSVIERVYIDQNSPCGDVKRFAETCTLERLEQCDPSGSNCLLTVEGGEVVAQASTQYLTYTSSAPLSGSCGACSVRCLEWGWDGCLQWGWACDSPPIPPAGCTGSCPSGAAYVATPSNSAVQTGTSVSYSQSDHQASCYSGEQCDDLGCYPIFNPDASFPIAQNTYYADPRVCNHFSGSIENYTACMDGQNINLSNKVASGVPITQTQTFDTRQVWEHYATINYVRTYGGPDVSPFLNGWNMKARFSCGTEQDNCQSLRDQGCTLYAQTCANQGDIWCSEYNYTYRCGGKGFAQNYQVAYNCAGNIRCMGSDCVDPSYQANQDIAAAYQFSEIMNAVRMDATETKIFPGKVMTCQTGPKNCCNANTGGVSIADYVLAAKSAYTIYSTAMAWEAAGGAYAAGTATVSAYAGTAAVLAGKVGLGATTTTVCGMTGVTITSTTIGTATVTTTSGGIAGAAAGTTVVTGSAATTGAMTMLAAAATVLAVFAIVVAAVVIAMMIYNSATACNEEDMETSIKLGFRLCHQVGERSGGSYLGLGTKKRAVWCCFGSILARLVHEQGRPQIGRGWGSPDNPDCGGFAHGEFSALDFTQMNLQEYMQYVQEKVQLSPEEVLEIQQRATTMHQALQP